MSHTHWDREWYVPLERFRSRLVVTVDRVLDLLAVDPGWSFVLDGQVAIVEDYLADRPQRRDDLTAAVRAGRLSIGPWYVQPDSLLPSGEAHIRNLLEGRAAGASLGPLSRVAYTPDSFGHPAWFPTLFRGFDLDAFVFWRGHGDERDRLPARWRWRAADGAEIVALHLEASYLAASSLEPDVDVAAGRLRDLAAALAVRSPGRVVLMNGVDHSAPDPHTAGVVAALERLTGWDVRRSTLDDAIADLVADAADAIDPIDPIDATDATDAIDTIDAIDAADTSFEDVTLDRSWQGSLTGGRDANLLPGVWSSRLDLKLANHGLESALRAAEHLAAVGAIVDAVDERPVLRRIRRSMLENQAHDTLGGCSVDRVVDEALARSSAATEAALATADRLAERMSGLGPDHLAPWSDEWDVAVWNPLPWRRRVAVRIPVNGRPAFRVRAAGIERHPAHVASLDGRGFLVDGVPARVLDGDPDGDRFAPEQRLVALHTEVDVPPLGWRRVRIGRTDGPSDPEFDQDLVDTGTSLDHPATGVRIEVAADGTVTFHHGDRHWAGLFDVVELGDRGDTYDLDLLGDPHDPGARPALVECSVQRRRHDATGTGEIAVHRRFLVPSGLEEDPPGSASVRMQRSRVVVPLDVMSTFSFAPDGLLEAVVVVESTARDHVVRLRMPMGSPSVRYATQFGEDGWPVERRAERWVHPAPPTFCHQGWVAGGGLLVLAPGLPEAAMADGDLDLTLLRAVGWMSRPDLRTRPGRASPAIPVPGAQLGRVEARLGVSVDPGTSDARWRALWSATSAPVVVASGDRPLVPEGQPVIGVEGGVTTACKPAEDGDGVVVRVWNPSDVPIEVVVRSSVTTVLRRCRLDESPFDWPRFDGSDAVEVDARGTPVRLAASELATFRLDVVTNGG